MPMLADLDHPPRSRTRDLLVGGAVALVIVSLVVLLLLPRLVAVIVGNASDYDQRLRAEDAYMQTLCTEALVLARDEALCKCVLAVEVPSLDCRQPFLRWSLDRHHEACADPETHKRSLTFCTCIDTLAEKIPATEAQGAEAGPEIQRVGKCLELPDAFPLPDLAALAPQPAS